MVGRFVVRPGDGEFVVWDNAMNGSRGSAATPALAHELAGELELQFNAHGPRDPATVRRLDQPVVVDTWQRQVGELDAWVSEGGRWIGRVTMPDGTVQWIGQNEVRPSGGVPLGSRRRADGVA